MRGPHILSKVSCCCTYQVAMTSAYLNCLDNEVSGSAEKIPGASLALKGHASHTSNAGFSK